MYVITSVNTSRSLNKQLLEVIQKKSAFYTTYLKFRAYFGKTISYASPDKMSRTRYTNLPAIIKDKFNSAAISGLGIAGQIP